MTAVLEADKKPAQFGFFSPFLLGHQHMCPTLGASYANMRSH